MHGHGAFVVGVDDEAVIKRREEAHGRDGCENERQVGERVGRADALDCVVRRLRVDKGVAGLLPERSSRVQRDEAGAPRKHRAGRGEAEDEKGEGAQLAL